MALIDNREQPDYEPGKPPAGQLKPSLGVGGVGVGTHVGDIGEVGFDATASYNPLTGNYGFSPTATIGDSGGSKTGSKVGAGVGAVVGTAIFPGVGTIIGSFLGSAIGSGIGDLTAGDASLQREGKRRRDLIGTYEEHGFIDKDRQLVMPDGSTFDMRSDSEGKEGHRSYEIDYTQDLDYTAGMAGITLSRLQAGRSDSKAVDQVGNGYGNAFLGTSGRGGEYTPDNFYNVMTNARATYAKAGIKSKEEMMAMANRMYAEGRINDFDYATMKQTATMVFDRDFTAAQKLMAGRNAGVDAAKSGAKQK